MTILNSRKAHRWLILLIKERHKLADNGVQNTRLDVNHATEHNGRNNLQASKDNRLVLGVSLELFDVFQQVVDVQLEGVLVEGEDVTQFFEQLEDLVLFVDELVWRSLLVVGCSKLAATCGETLDEAQCLLNVTRLQEVPHHHALLLILEQNLVRLWREKL